MTRARPGRRRAGTDDRAGPGKPVSHRATAGASEARSIGTSRAAQRRSPTPRHRAKPDAAARWPGTRRPGQRGPAVGVVHNTRTHHMAAPPGLPGARARFPPSGRHSGRDSKRDRPLEPADRGKAGRSWAQDAGFWIQVVQAGAASHRTPRSEAPSGPRSRPLTPIPLPWAIVPRPAALRPLPSDVRHAL